MLVVIYAKLLHRRFIQTIYKNCKSVFLTHVRENKNFETYICVSFEQLKELKQF